MKLTFYTAPKQVLINNGNKPMTVDEIWQDIITRGYMVYDATKTQQASLSSILGSSCINSAHKRKRKNIWFETLPNKRPAHYKLIDTIYNDEINVNLTLEETEESEIYDEILDLDFENDEKFTDKTDLFKFWKQFLEEINKHTTIFEGRTATETTKNWLSGKSGTSELRFPCVANSKFARIEVYIKDNKTIFDNLFESKLEIETELGLELIWERLDDKKASRISLKKEGELFNVYDEFNWGRIIHFFSQNIAKFVSTLEPYIQKALQTNSIKEEISEDYSEEESLSFVEAAKFILEENDNKPLTSAEIWQQIQEKNVKVNTNGKNAATNIGAILQRNSEGTTYTFAKKNPTFKLIDGDTAKFIIRRYVPKYVRESLEEYGFIHINSLREILANHNIKI